jgi:hypothetical protein
MGELVESGSKYTDEDRRIAVVEYAVHGVMSKVSKSTGIPETTLSSWKRSDWWVGQVAEFRTQIEEAILSNNLKIATRAGEEIIDRIDNGDTQIVQGKPVKVPVKARDLAVVGGISQDKARVQLGQPTSISSNTTEKLAALAEHFRKLASEKTVDGEVVENMKLNRGLSR